MSKRTNWFLLTAAVFVLQAPAIQAGGFAIPEQGAKAMALGGAFAAQADDPTALFYNVGGLAFVVELGDSRFPEILRDDDVGRHL